MKFVDTFPKGESQQSEGLAAVCGQPWYSESPLPFYTEGVTGEIRVGFNPMAPRWFSGYDTTMKTYRYHPQKKLTFGDYVASVYKTCGNKQAQTQIQIAVNEHQVHFLGGHHVVIS